MVTKLNTEGNSNSAGVVNIIKLLHILVMNFIASIISILVARVWKCLNEIMRAMLFGMFFLIVSAFSGHLYAQNPVLTIEANPYSYADDGGNNYIIVSDRDLTQALMVNYQVIKPGTTPSTTTVTFPVSETFTGAANTMVTTHIREIRIIVADSAHTEVKLVAGTNYELGTPSAVTKVDAHEIATGDVAVHLFFVNDTVEEGEQTPVIVRWTPQPRGRLYTFQYKIGESSSYVGAFNSALATHIGEPSPEINTSGQHTTTHARQYYYTNIQTKERDLTTDSPELYMRMEPSTQRTSVGNLDVDSIIIKDDDGDPQVSIETETKKVLKGTSFPITISGPSSLDSTLSVAFSHDDFSSGHFVSFTEDNATITSPITLNSTTKSRIIMVNTNASASGDGAIQISLMDGTNYDLESGKSTVLVKVIDPQSTRPQISVNNNNTNEIAEGANMATFNIVSNVQAPKGGIEVRYSLNQVQDFFDLPDDRSATIPETRTSVQITFTGRVADTMFSGDGLLTMILLDDTTPATYQVNVTNDAHIARVSVADSMRTAGKVYMKLLGSSTITEGQRAEVQIGLGSILTTAKKIYVNVDQLSTGNYLASDPPTFIEIPAGSLSAVYVLATQDDSIYDPTVNAVFSLTENIPEVDYQISTTDNEVTVKVNDNDDPPDNLSIIPLQPTVVEGVPSILFQLTTSVEHTFDFNVNVSVEKNSGGDFLNLSPPQGDVCSGATTSLNCTIRFTARSKFKHFTVSVKPDNNIDQSDGLITATITSVSQSAVMINDSAKSTQVTIVDSDAPPVMKLAITSSNVTNDTIFETNAGQDIEFTYSVKTDSSAGITTEESTSDITIHYSVVENVGDFLTDGEAGDDKTAVLDAGDDDGDTFVVNIEGDTKDEINGNFTVTLKPDVDTNTPKTYTVSEVAEEKSITIEVKDDEVPIVTITTSQSTVSESEDIIVNLATDIAPHQDLEIDICVSDGSNTSTGCSNPASSSPSGDFLKTPLTPIMVTLPVGANSVSSGQNYTIKLDDDDAIENDGSVIAYFAYTAFTADPTGYVLDFTSDATKSQISVMVEDNDPSISIAADDSDDSIVEGEDAVFTITSNAQITAQQLLVQVKISQEGEYWDLNNNMTKDSTPLEITQDQDGIRSIMVPIPVGSNSASFTIGTDDDVGDGAREDSGSISAEIIVPDQNPEYSKGSNFKAVLNVVDNDDPTPEISIQSVQTDAVEEGETIVFELTANKAIPDNGLEILVCIRDGTKKSDNTGCTIDTMGVGDYLAEPVPKQITMPANAPELTVRIEVPTVDDNSIDVVGTIYAEVITNSDDDSYRPLTLRNSATVQITDNDPSLSISPKDGKGVIAENEGPAEFVITSNVAPTSQLSVRVIMSEVGGNYLKSEDEVTRELSIDFPAGQTEVDFPFDIDDDANEEAFGGVRAELDSREQFTVGYFVVNERDSDRSSSAVVIVNDDDGGNVPTISIAGVKDAVNEGEGAVFEVTTTTSLPLGSTLPVQIMVEEGTPSYIADSADLKIHTVMIRSGVSGSTGELTIKTSSNSEDEVHGSIKATIQSDSENYRVASVNFATVAILDDDGADIPAVSIITTTPNITEGNTANFMVKSARSRDSDLIVNINIADPNNFIIWRIPNFITIPSGEKEAGFTIATGTQSDDPGSITVAIVNTDRYDIVLPMMQVVEVEAQADTVDRGARISVADVAVNSILELLNVSTDPSPASTESSRTDTSYNLPVISIIAISRQVDEGLPVQFLLTSRLPLKESLRVSVNISGTTGTIESDSIRTITIGTQLREVSFEIPTIEDNRAEADGYVTATLNQSPNYRIDENSFAVVTVSDLADRERRRNQLETANREVLPNLHNALGVANWSNVSNQIELAFAGKTQSSLIVGGQSSMNQILTSNVQAFDNESWSLRSLLGNSSFSFDLVPSDQGNSLGTVWGLGEQQNLSQHANDGTNLWTADLFTAQFGSDVKINDQSLAGLSVSTSDSTIEFGNEESTSIDYNAKNNYIQSYLGWQAPDQNTQFQIATGIGFGEIELIQNEYDPMYLHSTNYMLALKGSSLLFSSPKLDQQMMSNVSIFGDSYFSQLTTSESTGFLDDMTSNASWSQLGLEVTNQYEFNPNQSIQLRTTFSGIYHSETEELNLGLITQTGFTFSDQLGMLISGTGQLKMYQEQQTFENFGIRGEISFDQGRDGQGILFSMIPTWNFNESNAENQSFTKHIVNQNINELFNSENNTKLGSEIGYGITTASGWVTMTPYTGVELSNEENQSIQIGNRISLGTGVSFLVENAFKFSEDDSSENEFKISGQLRW